MNELLVCVFLKKNSLLWKQFKQSKYYANISINKQGSSKHIYQSKPNSKLKQEADLWFIVSTMVTDVFLCDIFQIFRLGTISFEPLHLKMKIIITLWKIYMAFLEQIYRISQQTHTAFAFALL